MTIPSCLSEATCVNKDSFLASVREAVLGSNNMGFDPSEPGVPRGATLFPVSPSVFLWRLHPRAVNSPSRVKDCPTALNKYPPSLQSTYFLAALASVPDRGLSSEAWVPGPAPALCLGQPQPWTSSGGRLAPQRSSYWRRNPSWAFPHLSQMDLCIIRILEVTPLPERGRGHHQLNDHMFLYPPPSLS